MSNVTVIKDKDGVDYVIIDNGNDEFTSMPKAVYDAMQDEATAK
jgi:hypothetical protein